MIITDLAIRYRTSVLVLTALLVIGGLSSYITLPKEAQPSIEVPNIIVTTIYPGVSPADIESLLTQPIEREIQGLNGIKEIRSTSSEGASSIVIEFEPNISIDDARQKVREKVDLAKSKLPTEVEDPMVSEIDLSEFPIMTINLAADYSLTRLKETAEDLQDALEAIPSVLEVDLIGGLEREVQVNVDLNALQGYNLSFNDLISTIQQENTTIPGGSIDVDPINYLVRVSGEFDDPRQIESLVVKMPEATSRNPDPAPIHVRDVAEVVFGFKERASYARLEVFREEIADDQYRWLSDEEIETLQVVSLNIKKRSGENILDTVTQVKDILADFPMPSGTRTVITGDISKNVRTLINDLENNIISGLIFVVAVLLFFLGIRNALLVGIAIPLSMFTGFIIFQVLGYTLNFIILFSLIIALGMLVDNAVVIVENIYRFREEGYSRFEAARRATGEVGGAVVASTATTICAFFPMMFWPGIMGEFMGYLPLTLIVTLTSSLFVALIINPVITGFLMRLDREQNQKAGTWGRRIGLILLVFTGLIIGLVNPITLGVLIGAGVLLWALNRFVLQPIGSRFMSNGLPKLVARYRDFLDWMLQRDYTVRWAYLRNTFSLASLTLGIVLLILGGAIFGGAGALNPALVLLVPGGILAVLGLIGVLFHTVESVMLAGWTAVKFGVALAVIIVVTLIPVFNRGITAEAWSFSAFLESVGAQSALLGSLMSLPIILLIFGIIGGIFFAKRTRLILTDNRARLMNTIVGTLLAIGAIFSMSSVGVEMFPETDPNQIMVRVKGRLGTHLEASDTIAETAKRRVDNMLTENRDAGANVGNLLVNVGVGGANMFGMNSGPGQSESSQITLNIVDYADRAEPSTVTMNRLREQLESIPGADIEFNKDQAGPPTGAPINIEISGEDFSEIVRISTEIKQMLTAASESGTIAGLVDISDNLQTGRPELSVNIDRERAGQFGLNTRQIAQTIRTAINGIEASKFRDGEDEYDITVRLRETDRASLESLQNLTILHEGQQIPLSAVAELEIGGGLGSITRLDLQRVAIVQGQTAPGFQGDAVLQAVQAHLQAYQDNLPTGYVMNYTGENEEMTESFSFLTQALLIGIVLIFMVLVAQFNRISAPFIIIVAVGLSLIGVLLGLTLTRTPFGLMTFIGIISLAGIVVNNAIVLVDYVMQLQERGLSKHDAVIQGGATRLRPVLLTAFTTILGLIPLTFGINVDFIGLLTNLDPSFQIGSENTQFWGPMGTAIISGLTFATFLTLVIVPVMYSLFDSLANRLNALFKQAPETTSVAPDGMAVAFTGTNHPEAPTA